MPDRIFEFYLTHHFMLRGWDRSIDIPTLKKLLPHVDASNSDKKMIVVTPSFYNSKGIEGKPNQCLVLVIKRNYIKTGFWCNNPNYLFKKDREAEFQWLY